MPSKLCGRSIISKCSKFDLSVFHAEVQGVNEPTVAAGHPVALFDWMNPFAFDYVRVALQQPASPSVASLSSKPSESTARPIEAFNSGLPLRCSI